MRSRHDACDVSAPPFGAFHFGGHLGRIPPRTADASGLLHWGKYCHAKNATSMLVHHFFTFRCVLPTAVSGIRQTRP
ncbi:hypothetical protein X946_3136 [Burkholderia sp. ABCPW 111]|nr:hypothetical protein X946_3136 [Burkholderia sp. ABCPW 111]